MSAPAITLREASQADAEALATLRVEAMRESLEHVGRFDPERARDRFLSGFLASHTRHVFDNGTQVGFVVVRPSGTDLLLDHLYIHPARQGRGIGSIVLQLVFEEADRTGKRLRVGALKESRSNNFYQRHGFEAAEQGEWDNYYVRHPMEAAQASGGREGPRGKNPSKYAAFAHPHNSMTDATSSPEITPERPALPDHLSVDPRSPHHVAAIFEHDIGIRFNNKERMDVEEYCISEGWVKVPAGKALDRKGKPLIIKLKGKVEAFYR